jgi:hypothetical protein
MASLSFAKRLFRRKTKPKVVDSDEELRSSPAVPPKTRPSTLTPSRSTPILRSGHTPWRTIDSYEVLPPVVPPKTGPSTLSKPNKRSGQTPWGTIQVDSYEMLPPPVPPKMRSATLSSPNLRSHQTPGVGTIDSKISDGLVYPAIATSRTQADDCNQGQLRLPRV